MQNSMITISKMEIFEEKGSDFSLTLQYPDGIIVNTTQIGS